MQAENTKISWKMKEGCRRWEQINLNLLFFYIFYILI